MEAACSSETSLSTPKKLYSVLTQQTTILYLTYDGNKSQHNGDLNGHTGLLFHKAACSSWEAALWVFQTIGSITEFQTLTAETIESFHLLTCETVYILVKSASASEEHIQSPSSRLKSNQGKKQKKNQAARWRQYFPLKCLSSFTGLQHVTSTRRDFSI
jgi:hypothetical protein